MAMAENKTKPTSASVAGYITSRANAEQKADCRTLMALFKRLTSCQPKMWGSSIVGYGSYRYTYESGRSGDMPLAAFAIRGRELVVYLDAEDAEQRALLAQLGKHKMGKSCLYLKRLGDIDISVLEQLVVGSMVATKRRYG
jgi:ribosomal protein S17E